MSPGVIRKNAAGRSAPFGMWDAHFFVDARPADAGVQSPGPRMVFSGGGWCGNAPCIELKPYFSSLVELTDFVVVVQVDFFSLVTAPETLDENVVEIARPRP